MGKMSESESEFMKLSGRVQQSWRRMEPFRRNRLNALKQYAGSAYGENGGKDSVVNMMEIYVNILLQHLVSNNPRVRIGTDKRILRANARYLSIAINHVISLIDLQASLRLAVMESLFSIGCIRVGVTAPERSEVWGWNNDGMLPFADPVFFDDLVIDMSAERIDQAAYIGNRYWEHIDDIRSDSRNDPEAAAAVKPGDSNSAFGMNGESAAGLGGDENVFGEDYKRDEMAQLWDVWVPRKKKLVTFCQNNTGKPLREEVWDGPPGGPYHLWWYGPMMNNIIPVPPVANISALADLVNSLWNKMGEQASRQKTVTFVRAGSENDGTLAVRSNDGDVISVINPDSIREVKYGGVDQGNLSFSAFAKQTFSYMAGNLDTLGGLAAGADTLGQEQLLSSSASGRIRNMQKEVVRVTRKIMRDIGWYIWNDPLVRLNLSDSIPGTDINMELTWPMQLDEFGMERDLRKGMYSDFNFEIEPFSLHDMSPAEKAQAMRSVFQQDILPAMPIMAQQGMAVDMAGYLEQLAELLNLTEEMQSIVKFSAPIDSAPSVSEGLPKPPQTTRQYDRVVRPGGPSVGGMERQLAMGAGAGANGEG
jgi:hypothetical protein